MKLRKIKIQGFRPFYDPIEIDFCDLTMLIGNNDSGKSSILDILDFALSSGTRPDDGKDYFTCADGRKSDEITVELDFESGDVAEAERFGIDGAIHYRVVFSRDNVRRDYSTMVPEDDDLRCDFPKLNAGEQKALMAKYEPEALERTSNAENRLAWFVDFVKTVPHIQDWEEVPSDFFKLLPRIQRYSAMDYSSPEKIINTYVQQIFETVLYKEMKDEETDERELRQSLKKLQKEAEEKINIKVAELKESICRYAPSVTNISYEPQIDFTRGFQSGEFKIDEGQGEHYLDKSGDGTKRKVFLAVTDWDRQTALSMQAAESSMPDIIRAYDEPDTNLDYQAQRQLYRSIQEITSGENTNIQAIVCTHSPRMIDRAPAQSIRMLREKDERRVIEKLETDGDDSVEVFLRGMARELGITNTLMFYENCFIMVEGATEHNALPTFYQTLYGHSMLEDGINIINVKGNGAFKEFIRLLSRNRQELLVVLMDQDSENSKEKRMTVQILRENGFSEEFCNERIVLVGNQEFEDIFPLDVIADAFNLNWPKNEGRWTSEDFSDIDPEKKFSKELQKIWNDATGDTGDYWGKPLLGMALGKVCGRDDIPEEICALFNMARDISGCNG